MGCLCYTCVKWDACAICVLNGMHTMKCTRSDRYKQAVMMLSVSAGGAPVHCWPHHSLCHSLCYMADCPLLYKPTSLSPHLSASLSLERAHTHMHMCRRESTWTCAHARTRAHTHMYIAQASIPYNTCIVQASHLTHIYSTSIPFNTCIAQAPYVTHV